MPTNRLGGCRCAIFAAVQFDYLPTGLAIDRQGHRVVLAIPAPAVSRAGCWNATLPPLPQCSGMKRFKQTRHSTPPRDDVSRHHLVICTCRLTNKSNFGLPNRQLRITPPGPRRRSRGLRFSLADANWCGPSGPRSESRRTFTSWPTPPSGNTTESDGTRAGSALRCRAHPLPLTSRGRRRAGHCAAR